MKFDFRVRQTSEYVFWNHSFNGSILNLSLVDLLFSVQCKKIQKRVKRTIQHTFKSIMVITIEIQKEYQFVRCLSQYSLLEFHPLFSIYDG